MLFLRKENRILKKSGCRNAVISVQCSVFSVQSQNRKKSLMFQVYSCFKKNFKPKTFQFKLNFINGKFHKRNNRY